MGKKRGILFLIVVILISTIVTAVDTDGDGLSDAEEIAGWYAEYYDASNDRIRLFVTSDPNDPNTDDDGAGDLYEDVFKLNSGDDDTDGDVSIDKDPNDITSYAFPDLHNKHFNDFCEPKSTISYWRSIACDGSTYFNSTILDGYIFSINRLSDVFASTDYNIDYWFTPKSVWNYNDSNINFADSWTDRTYDDSSWNSGNAYLGFNETSITTTLSYGADPNNKYITYYFRKYFNVSDASSVYNMEFAIDYDDGFIAYLNGNEITSSGVSSNHNSYATYHESSIGDFLSTPVWPKYNLTAAELGYLVNGQNVIAVEVHINAGTSSDIVMDAYLATYSSADTGRLSSISDMCDILSTDGYEKELLYLWLNTVSGYISYQENIN
jgi:hypothetical protein